MNEELIAGLRRLAGSRGVVILDEEERVRLQAERCGLKLSIIVPRSVLEFFVEATDGTHQIEDWLNYAGYDAMPYHLIADEMCADVLLFAQRLLNRALRIAADGSSVEWQIGERWLQAVPFVPDADPSAGIGSRSVC